VSYANKAMIFNPTDANLSSNTLYTATITTGVKDSTGNALAAEYVWSFTTGGTSDDTAPIVVSTDPNATATTVPINRSVSALFSETLDPTTVNSATFTLAATIGSIPVNGAVSYESNTMIFNPTADLNTDTNYTATITNAVTDLAGNHLAAAKVWSFTTGTTGTVALAPVNLGTAANYVILAKSLISVTTTMGTAITGSLGISPAARTFVTGFSDVLSTDGTYSKSGAATATVTGKIYAANMISPTPSNLTTAVLNMQAAYTDAAGRPTPDFTNLHTGFLGGKILVPGLYKWGTGVSIAGGQTLTISGGATDVWIFQIAGDLAVGNAAIVTLQGGALAKNIFWQVAGGAGVSLGTTSQFKGIVLAQKDIVVNTGAAVKGRLLSQTQVTLDSNAITQPN